jgi:hypothetical protein
MISASATASTIRKFPISNIAFCSELQSPFDVSTRPTASPIVA